MEKPYIDLHCHPSLKPFGKSFQNKRSEKKNSSNPNAENSIWHIQRPKLFRKVLNVLLRLTKWRQSDFTSVLSSPTNVIVVSLYPLEKGLVVHSPKKDVKLTGRLVRNLATGIGMKRITYLQTMKDYFTDLVDEYQYYKQLHNTIIDTDGRNYKLVKSAAEIDYSQTNTLHVILSIEGAHVFNTGLQLAGRPKAIESEVLAHINTVKNWEFKPFFIGLAHHFDNELCGFSESLSGLVGKLIDQQADERQGITAFGKQVIDALLNNDQGKRILIDLKHMNHKSRYEYYEILEAEYKGQQIPLIVSHGAINGKLHPVTHNKVWKAGFNVASINFYFDEIQRIEASKGIFGIQLDERRIYNSANKEAIYRQAKKTMTVYGYPELQKNAYFIWRQIEAIGEYLDTIDRNAWDIQALGTDFDGIIDPLNGWWSARELGFLSGYLEHHAQDFLNSERGKRLQPQNQLAAETIVSKCMFVNAQGFIARWF